MKTKRIKYEVVKDAPPRSRTPRNSPARQDLIKRALKLKEGTGLKTPFSKEANTLVRAVRRDLKKKEKNKYFSFHLLKDMAGKITHVMLYRQK